MLISGLFVKVITNCDLTVSFDGHTLVTVATSARYSGKLTGLCGDCSGYHDNITNNEGSNVSNVEDITGLPALTSHTNTMLTAKQNNR